MEEIFLIEKAPAIKRGWLRALLMIVAYLIASIVFGGIAAVIIGLANGIDLMNIEAFIANVDNIGIILIIQLISLIVALIIIWIFRKYIDKKSILTLGFKLKGRSIDVVLGFLLGFFLMFLGFIILRLINDLEVISISFNSKAVFGGFFLFLIVAITEEAIFRGYILSNLMDTFKNKYIALIVSSIVFAIFHGMNPNLNLIGFINLIVAGIALGISYIHIKNLWFPILFHLSWNYFQGPIFGFEVSGMDFISILQQKVTGNELITGGDFGFEGSIILTVLLLGMIVIIDRILVNKVV
ncbi:MAG: CPBP family intramembrane metalloprotease [Bacteroidales bacterium]|nr:CPBP family intramembrane metalloprotease [Bacteroidales bacterium]